MDEPDDGLGVRPPTLEDLVEIARQLNREGARYLLIGGFAVIAHGGGRTTKDIDFLVDTAPENIARIKRALRFLPDRAVEEIAEDDLERYPVVRIADEVMIDLLGAACAISYADAFLDSQVLEIEGVEIPIASKQTLIATKRTFRPSDEADSRFLQGLIDEERGT